MCLKLKYILNLFLCCSFIQSLSAQNNFFKNYTIQDGLSHNQVNCIAQDNFGFMWFGTSDGLCRYDGNTFMKFRHKMFDTTSICGNQITRIIKAGDNHFWIAAADGGVCLFNIVNYRVQSYQIKDSSGNIINHIHDIVVAPDGKVFLTALGAGLWCKQKNEQQFKKMHISMLSDYLNIYALRIIENKLWIAPSGSGLATINLNDNTLTYLFTKPANFPYPAHTINIISPINDNIYAVGGWDNALHLFNPVSKELQSFPINNSNSIVYNSDEILSIATVGNSLWCGSRYSGLQVFDLEKKQFTQPAFIGVAKSLSYVPILSVYCDSKERIWIGTAKGVFLYDPLLDQFNIHALQDEMNSAERVNTILRNQDRTMWVGSNYGLYLLDEQYRVIRKQPLPDKEMQQVTALYRDHRNNLYVGTSKSIYVLRNNNMWAHIKEQQDIADSIGIGKIISSRVQDFIETVFGDDTVLLASVYGYSIQMINPKTMISRAVWLYADNHFENLIRKLYRDDNGNLYACGASLGLLTDLRWASSDTTVQLPINTADLQHYKGRLLLKAQRLHLNGTILTDVFDFYKRENIDYVSIVAQGIYFNQGQQWLNAQTITHSDRFGNQGMFVAANGNLFSVVSGAIEYYSLKDKYYTRFDENDGIPSDGVHSYFSSGFNGDILVPGYGYFVSFNPSTLVLNSPIVPLYCTQIKSNTLNSDTLQLHPKVVLHAEDEYVQISFAALDYTSAPRSLYEYYLEGFDNNWISNGTNSTISFIQPVAGTYNLHVRALNTYGKKITDELIIPFIVIAPWYAQPWFYISILILLAGLGYGFYRFRINYWKRLHRMRLHIARDLHDDVGSALGSISFFTEAAIMQLRDSKNNDALQTIEQIGDTSRETIESIKDIVWTVNPVNDSVSHLVERIYNYLADTCANQKIKYQFNSEALSHNLKLTLEERRNIYLIFKEAIYNAIKYSGTELIDVIMESTNEYRLQMITRDYGNGLPENITNGNGLQNMKRRSEEMHAKILFHSDNGLTITLQLK